MNDEEKKSLRAELCKRWPKKFNKEDLDYWCRAMNDFGLAEVCDALTKFRNTSNSRPNPGAIFKLLPRKVAAEQAVFIEKPYSEVVGSQMGIPSSASPAEKLMRFWRSTWWRYKTDAEGRRAGMDHAAIEGAKRMSKVEGRDITPEEFKSTKTFTGMVAMWERQLGGMLKKCFLGCIGSLIAEGIPLDQAQDYSDWIETNPDQFRGFLNDLRNIALANPEHAHADMF